MTTATIGQAYVISLASRDDRHRDMERELQRLSWSSEHVTWYPAIDPRASVGFHNPGCRGSFLSHLSVLNMVRNSGQSQALILEDDCDFRPAFLTVLAIALSDPSWDICYFGHIEQVGDCEGPLVEWPSHREVALTHCYAVRSAILPILCKYLEEMLLRPSGSSRGGPMAADAALSWFRKDHPGVCTVLVSPSVARQRPTKSNITPRWFERVPGLHPAVSVARRFRTAISRRALSDTF